MCHLGGRTQDRQVRWAGHDLPQQEGVRLAGPPGPDKHTEEEDDITLLVPPWGRAKGRIAKSLPGAGLGRCQLQVKDIFRPNKECRFDPGEYISS